MSDDQAAPPPVTGDAAVDRVSAGLVGLEADSLSEQHERLAAAHEQLHAELSRDVDSAPLGS